MLQPEDIKALERQNSKTLAKWWGELNRWRWPEELPNPELEKSPIVNDRRWESMEWIMHRIGMRAVLREWNNGMSDAEFDESPAGLEFPAFTSEGIPVKWITD